MIFNKNFLLAVILIATTTMSCSDNVEKLQVPTETNITEIEGRLSQKFNASRFYIAPTENTRVQFTGTTTSDLNRLINQQSDENGTGVIIEIPKSTYYWNRVVLKSNIHLEIAGGTKIIFDGNSGGVFSIGGSKNGNRLKNVSISGKNGTKFTVDISSPSLTNKNVNVLKIGRVDNFRFADINIKDRRSSVNSIVLVHVPGSPERRPGPKDGIIENINQRGAHTGYGLVQTYNAQNVLFNNLSCEGGITLRMETDDKGMKDELKDNSKKGGVAQIFAHDIRNKNGLCAVMFSPHFVKNGKVTVEKVRSVGSAFAVRVEKGFLELFDKKNEYSLDSIGKQKFINFVKEQFPGVNNVLSGNPYKRNNGRQWATRLSSEASIAPRNEYVLEQLGRFEPGSFNDSSVTDVTAIFRNNGEAKIKQAHLKFIPCDLWENGIKNPAESLGMFNGFEYHGPSVALSYDNTNGSNVGGHYNVTLIGENFRNFPASSIQNIQYNTSAICNKKPASITRITASFPN
ncbi:Iota-carrageenase [uncultured Tenacibaculum sp.]|uniref:Iota-carrageenase n=1 Tax=uncultured Tenacibaculum sp. TaxID=174713 RepID=UPI00261B6066|nr:Iota-carrageenase [uncultured Tenacibaculum sp.]